MANFQYSQWGMTDLVPAFSQTSQQNYLLQALGIFEKEGSSEIRVSFDRLAETNQSLMNTPKKRYSFEHNSTERGTATNYRVEIPYFLRHDSITAEDFQQGKRRAGSTEEETYLDILGDYIQAHAKAHKRTVETMYARALFTGEVYTPFTKTEDPRQIIDYATSFDAPFMTETIDLNSSTTLDVLEAFNGFLDRINAAADGLYSDITRVIVFAGADAYNRLRFHPSMKEAFQYVSPLAEGNIIIQRQDLLPNVQTMSLPGLSVDVIKVTDPLLTAYLASNEMLMMPIFRAGTNAYQHIYSPASTNSRLARTKIAQEYFSYLIENDLGEERIYSEAGILPVNHVTNMAMRITATI
ncbi:major capsid protein [Pantoea sp. JKS000250]|uniref:major capsid protein n=1 Tax=Pantoea sp. JKS000250 TaxID=1938795 RepID=UPI000D7688FF|nr:major capsid protein [Pantoea sp. JKS000250]PXW21008.1 major capsid protein E [Pantoea sp. JKS000250]